MKRLERLAETLKENADFRYPDYKVSALEAVTDLIWLLELLEKDYPEAYQKYLQWWHDNH